VNPNRRISSKNATIAGVWRPTGMMAPKAMDPPGLLRPRRERPGDRRTTEERDELAPLHIEHGGLPPLCAISATDRPVLSVFRHHQPAIGRPANPWGKPEIF
jgi:hypothetical protein